MPKNVVITPLSGLVDFYDLNSNLDAKIQVDDAGSLSITNTGGTLTLGNTAANVVIGDGTNSVDMIFEQNGAIRGTTGRTLTLGSVGSNVAVQSPMFINSPLLNTSTTGEFEVRQTVSSWTSTSHPLIKWSWNATYDDNLYLASGGNAAGTTQTALVISENSGILIGKASATPNATSVLSSTVATINASTGGISTLGVIISSGTGYRVATGVDAGGNLNLGRIDNVASTPFIDFNCGATTVDHDIRLQAGGGTGVNGGGTLTVTGNLSVSGNLTINGTTTTVNSTTVTVDDPIFTLGGDTAPTVDDNKDRGIEFRWHDGTSARTGFFGYDDSTGYLTFIPNATNTSEVFSGTQGDIQATNFRGALIGNSSTATTLATARNINEASFNGSADITIISLRPMNSPTSSPSNGYSGAMTFASGSWANNNTAPYSDNLIMRSYTNSSFGNDNLISFRKDAIGMRIWQQTYGSATAFSTFKDVAFTDSNTFTGTQTFSGSSSVLGVVLKNAAEVASISATAATGTINYDITTQSVLYYTTNASANWTVNFRASSGTTLNTALATGQSVTVAFLVTQGSAAYFNNSVQVDGTTSGVTTRWIGGAPTAGNASGIDSYRYLIIKTAASTYTVLASVTQFKV
jgi:hypothetical protein